MQECIIFGNILIAVWTQNYRMKIKSKAQAVALFKHHAELIYIKGFHIDETWDEHEAPKING